ncbi:hypothetical protein A2397_00925 [Candidatus Amesbacteria bacterium RIFOXYB1_FULL_44_23]|uniref:Type IV secretion system protein n=1 Tax=Candidatus Amesbacteria bacterium RIFOXYB1_FULL_44_23 TaxID=1797263 RepID=A0A1F4ZT45_9BACT|nr:MAG: hypothetical protein A2397_00925 [Candidatus Amesbacteria bacterium RIFOXYB1_FULL_44_23]
MKLFSKKISSLLLVLAYTSTFLVSSFSPLLSVPIAQAQCVDNPGEYYCTGTLGPPPIVGAQSACAVTSTLDLFLGRLFIDPDNPPPAPTQAEIDLAQNECEILLYEINRYLFASPPPAPWYNPSVFSFARKVFDTSNPDEIYGERYTFAQVNWIMNSIFVIVFPPLQYTNLIELFDFLTQLSVGMNRARDLFTSDASDAINTLPKLGFIGGTYFLMAQVPKLIFIDPIASGVGEVKQLASKFNIVSPALAQASGVGYEKLGLGTVRGMWIATRNMAYLIATIVLVAAGLMVIFRTKISPQASVTVQMIIPRLIISLTLVTFSFAIVGFVIDMMYVIITAVLGMIAFTQGVTGITVINDLGQAITSLTGNFNFVSHFLFIYIFVAILLLLATIILAIVLAFASFGGAGLIVPLLGIVMGFFMWSVYVWAKIVGQLIVAYITLMLLTIAGPIMIIVDILPTSTGGFKKWFSCVVGNASVFVTYALLAILIHMMFGMFSGSYGMPGFQPYVRTGGINASYDLPLFVSDYPAGMFLQYLLYVGFMSIVPTLVSSVKNIFCKTTDFSNFLENTVKDTVGSFTKAGDQAGKASTEWKQRRDAELAALEAGKKPNP